MYETLEIDWREWPSPGHWAIFVDGTSQMVDHKNEELPNVAVGSEYPRKWWWGNRDWVLRGKQWRPGAEKVL
jgi:hypothetical protein